MITLKKDRWVKCLAQHGNVRGVAVHATELVRHMAKLHGLKGPGAKGLGEATISALLVASYCKASERINLNIRGSGHIRQALVDAYPDGTTRGYVIERELENVIPLEGQATGPWGEGLLSILRTKNAEGEQPYIGTVPLLTGHLAKDLTFYWVQSEQIPSAVGIAVNMEGDQVTSAGGFLIQALPGASPIEIASIEHHIHEIQSLASRIAQDADPIHLLGQIFQSTAFAILEEKSLKFDCSCSLERVQRALVLVGAGELKAMLEENNEAKVHCDFCAKTYTINAEELKKLIARSESNGSESG